MVDKLEFSGAEQINIVVGRGLAPAVTNDLKPTQAAAPRHRPTVLWCRHLPDKSKFEKLHHREISLKLN